MNAPQTLKPRHPKPLKGIRIISLALNLPGPAALRRLADMGATCTKINPPAGDAMKAYTAGGYATLHAGVREVTLDLKDPKGQSALHKRLATTDVLLTSFRPSALHKLGLAWSALRKRHPQLSLVQIVGAPGPLAEVPGHDLTYQAEVGLVPGLQLPASLFADMGGALMASEAALKAVLQQKISGRGSLHEVALSDAAAWLALPRQWRMTTPEGPVGGAHAGYGLYPCKDGRVAVAALEPHFAQRLCEAAAVPIAHPVKDLFKPEVAQAIARFLGSQTKEQLNALSEAKDIPLLTLV
jgi:crotonobetainyl-CoA:carnitine CoA-transferase CaiB-like acyl-CoA transferase